MATNFIGNCPRGNSESRTATKFSFVGQVVLMSLLLTLPRLADAAGKPEYDISNSWFKPAITVNNDTSVCSPLLNGYLRSFRSGQLDNPLDADIDGEGGETESTKIISEKLKEIPWKEVQIGNVTLKLAEFDAGGKYFAVVQRNYSIGWREGFHQEALINKPLSDYKLTEDNYVAFFEANPLGIFTRPGNQDIFQPINKNDDAWKDFRSNIYTGLANIYRDDANAYLLFKQSNSYLLLKLLDHKKLSLTCQLTTTPTVAQINEQVKQLASISALQTTLMEMMGTECNGGTMHALSNAQGSLTEAFNVMSYRPWILESKGDKHDANYPGSAHEINKNLETWGYSGIWQYSKYKNYLSYIVKAEDELGHFYAKSFSLSTQEAKQLAHTAISSALESGFDHGHIVDDAHDIHKMILEGTASVKDIDSLEIENDAEEKVRDYAEAAEESPLTFAITQPKTLSLLLKKSANPNEQNWFGKTPLMYAAQFNQTESARILLDHGARTETYTVKSIFSCINNTHLGALHYAVKYASKDFIDLLIGRGAPTSAKDTKGKTPFDYLTGNDNPNLTTANIESLKSDLLPPDDDKKRMLSEQENLKAEKLYHEKKSQEAYLSLKKALILDETNETALSNLALIALKLNKLAESAKASSQLIATTKSDDLKANAYFNLGLACRKNVNHYATINFDGNFYCDVGRRHYPDKKITDHGILSSFLSAYQLKPTKDRLSAVLATLQDEDMAHGKRVCFFPDDGSGVKSVYFNPSNMYFLLDASKSVPYKKVVRKAGKADQELAISDKESIPLTSTLKIERWSVESAGAWPVLIGNQICNPTLSKAYDENTRLLAVFPSSTQENSTPGNPVSGGRPFKELTIKLANTMPDILYFYGHNTEFKIEGDLSKTYAIYIHGNSNVTFPGKSELPVIRDGEQASLNSRVDFPNAMEYQIYYKTGLHTCALIDTGKDANITLNDALIVKNSWESCARSIQSEKQIH